MMYASGCHAYIYFIYGMYFCLNVVTEKKEVPEAVLIRALQPFDPEENLKQFSGPGKLCRELNIDRSYNGLKFNSSHLWIEKGVVLKDSDIVAAARIGIASADGAVHWPLRFCVRESPSLSKKY